MNRVLRRPPGVVMRDDGAQTILLDLDRGLFYGLSPSGRAVWHTVLRTPSIESARAALRLDAGVIDHFTRELVAQGLLQDAPANAPSDPAATIVALPETHDRPTLHPLAHIRDFTEGTPFRLGALELDG